MSKSLADMEGLFKALADETRLRILGLLMAGEVCVCHIHDSLKISQPKASRHLAYLRRAGLVATRRDGLWVHYRLANLADPVVQVVGDAVRHALTHVEAVHKDAARLAKTTGCCPPKSEGAGAACCSPLSKAAPIPTAALVSGGPAMPVTPERGAPVAPRHQ